MVPPCIQKPTKLSNLPSELIKSRMQFCRTLGKSWASLTPGSKRDGRGWSPPHSGLQIRGPSSLQVQGATRTVLLTWNATPHVCTMCLDVASFSSRFVPDGSITMGYISGLLTIISFSLSAAAPGAGSFPSSFCPVIGYLFSLAAQITELSHLLSCKASPSPTLRLNHITSVRSHSCLKTQTQVNLSGVSYGR